MKFKNYFSIAAIGVLAAISVTSCKKSSDANGTTATAQFVMSLNSDSSSINLSSTGNNNIAVNSIGANATAASPANVTFTSGTANVSSFKFEATKNGKPVEFVTNNLNNIDLFAAAASSINAKLDTGTYTNVEVRIKLAKSATLIPLVLKGTYTSFGGAVVPLQIDFNEDAEIRIEVKDKIVVNGKTDLATALKMHLNRLFAGVSSGDVDKATRTSGVILINSTLNTVIYNKVKTNIITSAGHNGIQIRIR